MIPIRHHFGAGWMAPRKELLKGGRQDSREIRYAKRDGAH
jgi:hypothetical protein